jgi:predicted PurR-regulated permease PerM
VLVFIGLAALFGYPLVNGLTHLIHKLPTYVKQVEQGKGALGRLSRRTTSRQWVDKNLVPKLSSFAKNLSKPALTLGKAAVSLLFALFVIFVLVVLLLLEGPKLRRGLLGMMQPERAARVWRISGEVSRSVTGFMLGNFITSIIAGIVVLVTLTDPGGALRPAVGLVGGPARFPAHDRGCPGRHPHRLFALTHSLSAFIVFAVVFLTYTQIENHILNPIVMSRTVRINPAARV